MSMKRTIIIALLVILLATTLISISGCGVVGANLRFEGLNLGTVVMEGKPLAGLPSDKVNLVLDVAAETIKVRTSASGTILTLVPSGATVTIDGDKVSFKGFKPE